MSLTPTGPGPHGGSVDAETSRLAAVAWTGAADGLLVVDADGRIVAANPAAVRALSDGGELQLPADLGRFFRPDAPSGLVAALTAAQGDGWRGEVVGAGGNAWELVLAPGGGEGGYLAGVLHDLRPLHARERERQELLSAVLHDVKGALTVILGYAELLTDPAETPSHEMVIDTLARIAECGEQINALVSNFGLFCRLRAGTLATDRRAVDLGEIVERVVQQHAARADRCGVAVSVEVPRTLEIRGDPAQLERAFSNLVSNAVKFTPAGGRVAVQASREDARVVVTVADSGPGLAVDDPEALFAKHRSRRPGQRGEGIGLGLAVARGIARAHGGELTLSAALGGGTEARLTLPVGTRAS